MLLKKIIKANLSKKNSFIKVEGISSDSRKVKKGDLFFALKGNKFDGNKFISMAIKKGAKAIISSSNNIAKDNKIPVIKVRNIKENLLQACLKFYDKKPKNIIAVTGTNGKSSVADFFRQILLINKIPVSSIGTLGIKKNKKTKKLKLTSPDIISLHKELYALKKSKIDNVIIEASSHGLKQGRLDGINFKAGVFTNFSQDHLDYHKTMKNYLKAKLILFKKILKKNKHIITDENIKEFFILKNIAKKRKLKLLSINQEKINKFYLSNRIIGEFQKKNLLMAVLLSKLCGVKQNKILPSLNKIRNVEGRLELIRKLPNKSFVYIDYAHTPDALYHALKSLKEHYKKNISLVFGCGGERDIKKRVKMAKISRLFCKKIYVTDDNPRNENPNKIRKSIIKNLSKGSYFNIGNRFKAIKKAIQNSEEEEIILIAGKGHETTQDYGNKIINISDKEIINKIRINKKKLKKKQPNNNLNLRVMKKIFSKRKFFNFNGISINSKKIKKNNLFVAIKGQKHDGHRYVTEALKKGASYSLVSKNNFNKNKKKLIICKNTKSFLNKFGSIKRNEVDATIIAITGSSGKTTLKTLIGNLLNTYEKTYFSPKSYNNHYGVPLSLCNLEKEHKYGVFEIGMSKAGEIDKLSKFVKPDLAVITNIAEAHIENFKSIKQIAKAKSEIINNINKNGILFLNRDDNFFNFLKKIANKKNIQTLSFGMTNKSDIYPISIKRKNEINILKIKAIDEVIYIKSKNMNHYNILSAVGVLKYLGLELKKINRNISFGQSISGRGKTHTVGRYNKKFKFIDESYNANPLSVKNAILNLSNIKKNNFKKYLFLGDMLELGDKSEFQHKKLSKIINNTDIDKIFVYGDEILNTFKYVRKNKQGNILQHLSDFDFIFSNIINKNDYLMIKGSNATGLNKLSRNIIKGKKNVI